MSNDPNPPLKDDDELENEKPLIIKSEDLYGDNVHLSAAINSEVKETVGSILQMVAKLQISESPDVVDEPMAFYAILDKDEALRKPGKVMHTIKSPFGHIARFFTRRESGEKVLAMQFTGDNVVEMRQGLGEGFKFIDGAPTSVLHIVDDYDNVGFVEIGDFVYLHGRAGRFRRVNPTVFAMRYYCQPEPDEIGYGDTSTWADETVQLEKVLKLVKLSGTPTHSINLSVCVGNPEDFEEVYDAFSKVMRKLAPDHIGVHLSSNLLSEDDEEN